MKSATIIRRQLPGKPRPLALFAAAATLAAVSPLPGAGAPAAGTAPAPKTHTLYMGADILVEQDKAYYRVQDVEGGSFIVRIGDKNVKIPADWGALKMKVDRSLKLSTTSVAVARLKVERVYTPGRDPVKKFLAAQGGMQAREQRIGALQAKLDAAQMMSNMMKAAGGVEAGFATNDPATLERQLTQQSGAALADYGNETGIVGHLQEDLGAEQFDAIQINCDVSAEKFVRKPYFVAMVQYHDPEDKPGTAHNWIYAAALDPLGGEERKVRVVRGGFPPGYILEKFQIHVYDGGRELATSVSEKQVPLTREEAFTYLRLDYLASHKGATLPAAAAMGRPSGDLLASLDGDELGRTFFVRVSPEGLPVAAYGDAAGVTPVGGQVARAIDAVRFYPALEKGKAVEALVALQLSRLSP